MTTLRRTAEEKVGDWYGVYNAVRQELTSQAMRGMIELVNTREEDGGFNVAAVNLGVTMSKQVMANDRMAAMVAALLTANGVKPVNIEDTDVS